MIDKEIFSAEVNDSWDLLYKNIIFIGDLE